VATVASNRARAHAPWSSSKVQTALRCPREFHYRYVEKRPVTDTSPESRLGKAVHAALEHVLGGGAIEEALAAAQADLPTEAERERLAALAPGIAGFVDRIAEFRRRRRVGRQLVEFSLAVREDLSLTQFHAGDAFYRGIFDAGYIFDDSKLAVIDHKCGERRTSLSFEDQLEGYAVLASAMFRHLRQMWLGVYWVADRALDWARPVSLGEVHERLVPRVLANIEAAALAVDDGPRPAPSDWCLFCSYRSTCPAAHDLLLEPVDEEEEPDP
jgi:RecB family exonuclease